MKEEQTHNTSYIPINCSYHDILLSKATLKEICLITYLEGEQERTVSAIITDVFTRKGEEFMHLDNGAEIRLDFIISVAGEISPSSIKRNIKGGFSCR